MGNTVARAPQHDDPPAPILYPADDIEEEKSLSFFTCEICIERMSSNKKFHNQNKCVHPPFCTDCITKYIQVKVEEDSMADVVCPGINCKNLLDPISCRPLIPHKLFDKWCDSLCVSTVTALDRRFCPNRNCSALIVNECGGNCYKSKCPNCKELFCFRCKIAWHAGYRCDESGEMRDRNDVLFGQLAERMGWRRCPNCGHSIQRSHGCNMMICRCNTIFCYSCGRKNVNYNSHICEEAPLTIIMDCLISMFLIISFIILLGLLVWSTYEEMETPSIGC